MTEKLFCDDPYVRKFRANVIDVRGEKVILDRTAFFPFSGGQAGDTGRIGKCKVINTVYDGEEIVHITGGCAIRKGGEVECELDWNRRYAIMKLHSAAHIVYELFVSRAGKKKVIGSNISESKARLDFESGESVSPLLPQLEADVNGFIADGHAIRTYEDKEKPGYRWWECEGMKMGCGGAHVKNTHEIVKISLKRRNIGSGKERIEVTLC